MLGFTAFIGFEAAAVLGEEARDPLRAITRAVLTTVLIALVYYVFVTWAMAIGFGAGNAAAWAKDPAALDTLAVRYVGDWLATVIDFALAIGAFVGALAGLNLATRMLFAMGRDGALPSALGWTHPRRRTPWVAIGVVSALTLVLVVAWGNHYGPITYFVLVATTATLAILVTYVLVAIAGIALLVPSARADCTSCRPCWRSRSASTRSTSRSCRRRSRRSTWRRTWRAAGCSRDSWCWAS